MKKKRILILAPAVLALLVACSIPENVVQESPEILKEENDETSQNELQRFLLNEITDSKVTEFSYVDNYQGEEWAVLYAEEVPCCVVAWNEDGVN